MFDDEIPSWSFAMRALTIASVFVLTAVAGLGQAVAKGCIKGALIGGLAGHAVGHGMTGAAAGCAVGHHGANKASSTNTVPTSTSASDSTTTSRSY